MSKEQVFIPYSAAFDLKALIGKFKVDSYADVEFFREKIALLPIAEFQQGAQGDQKKADLIWHKPSSVSKESFAWMNKEQFKQAIYQRGFEVAQIEFLEYWIVKDQEP